MYTFMNHGCEYQMSGLKRIYGPLGPIEVNPAQGAMARSKDSGTTLGGCQLTCWARTTWNAPHVNKTTIKIRLFLISCLLFCSFLNASAYERTGRFEKW